MPESRASAQRSLTAGVRAPKRLLAPETERGLTARQLEILDALEDSIMVESLANVTMAEIAKRMNCSLRTLYGIAPSKDEFVMTIVVCTGSAARQSLRSISMTRPSLASAPI